MPTVMLTFFRETYALAIFVHISNILAVTGPILTEAEILHRYFEDQPDSGNCHYDICPGNICPGDNCPGDICPFQEYILGARLKDANCHADIFPGNICSGNICPYQQYLSCYWSNFD